MNRLSNLVTIGSSGARALPLAAGINCTSLILSNEKDLFYLYGKVISPGNVIWFGFDFTLMRRQNGRVSKYSTSLKSLESTLTEV